MAAPLLPTARNAHAAYVLTAPRPALRVSLGRPPAWGANRGPVPPWIRFVPEGVFQMMESFGRREFTYTHITHPGEVFLALCPWLCSFAKTSARNFTFRNIHPTHTPKTGRIPEHTNANEIPTAPELFIDRIVVFEIQKHYSVIFLVDFINKYGRSNMNPPFTF